MPKRTSKRTKHPPRQFYRTVFQIEVLSEDEYPADAELEQIRHDILEGDCSGDVKCVKQQVTGGRKMAKLLLAQGSSPDFFNLADNGKDLLDR